MCSYIASSVANQLRVWGECTRIASTAKQVCVCRFISESDALSFSPRQLADLEARLGESQRSGDGLRSKLAQALATCRSKDEEIQK